MDNFIIRIPNGQSITKFIKLNSFIPNLWVYRASWKLCHKSYLTAVKAFNLDHCLDHCLKCSLSFKWTLIFLFKLLLELNYFKSFCTLNNFNFKDVVKSMVMCNCTNTMFEPRGITVMVIELFCNWCANQSKWIKIK